VRKVGRTAEKSADEGTSIACVFGENGQYLGNKERKGKENE